VKRRVPYEPRTTGGIDVAIENVLFARNDRTVLDIPELHFPVGASTAIFGPNGSGKTTLLRLIAALERPPRGLVRVGGEPVRPVRQLRERVAYAFQEAVFLRGTVRQNLELGPAMRAVGRRERRVRIDEVARECGITHLLERPVHTLSGGEAQRANLARTLALRAPLTLLDEPLSGLDRIGRAHLLDDLPRLLETFATTTILVTHDREEAFRLAERIVVLVDGRVHAAGPKREVFRNPPDRETAELLGFIVIETGEAMDLAIPSGSLRLGHGSLNFTLIVERVIDMGNHTHAIGRLEGPRGMVRADVQLPDDAAPPAPGTPVHVSATEHAVVPASGV
jgi:ABC-type sugar transport system ATPase subunit